ncbi:hypothetical protein NEUTE1DRAFT_118619 [Neurospora tetrasperma FGSC 2508]|uniref:Peptidase S28 n=1 Tax=Neurospora tetrasperma (strain FGSC 2508 / ATCC MYA-4615 / P0657) TaxID=510951 RepID=F8MZS1_NEUT8|nr:uncharacterized protein NEUTE1DRAFT_118619 [Neurospora tetrasperma FGSC 2508]EGO52058.1 hypothetical protein NEUTE1DRAFT_118619 [Neurospora tetrasperma FGSC 2508]
MMGLGRLLAATACVAQLASAFAPLTVRNLRLSSESDLALEPEGDFTIQESTDPTLLYPARTIKVPVDHFHNDTKYEPHTNDTFDLRYWFDATYYKKGGPVIVLAAGETSGVGRLQFLQKGIVYQLAKATGGVGVILEHRYYGKSLPTSDFSTKNLRFLTTDQALADTVYFAKNVKFAGLEHLDLTAPNTPYIAYGGSYAGAFVAFLRKLYPDVYWGAISSSGVTEAIYDYWQYYEAARIYGPKDCVTATQKLTHVVDNIILNKANAKYVQKLKDAFGLGNLTHTDDFANTISFGIAGLQSTNWDPALNDTSYGEYCNNVSSNALLYPETARLEKDVQELLTVGGYGKEVKTLTNQFLNYIGYVNVTSVQSCDGDQNACFTSYDSEFYKKDDLKQTWRLWLYQVCDQWGFLQTGSGVPHNQLPLISRAIDLNYTSIACREAFNINKPSDVESINKYGGFGISYPRLAIIDGEKDPWRAATPHAIGLKDRKSTISEPFILIKDGVHHWDENGVFPNETAPNFPPKPVEETQRAIKNFVQAWLQDFKKSGHGHGHGHGSAGVHDEQQVLGDL